MRNPRVRLRPEIEAMVPYRQGKQAPTDAFKLSSNENPYEPLPAVLAAIAGSSINRYPDSSALVLRERLSDSLGVLPDQIQVGAGSVSVLSQLITAAAGHGDEVVYSWRSFEAYPGLVMVAGATSVQVPNSLDHRHNLSAMAAAITERTRVVIVCSPNNPTGAAVTSEEFHAFMALVPPNVLVILDEAYIEFVTVDSVVRGIPLLSRYSNLVVLRTFSKAYGLAGLRIGYAVGPEYVMNAARSSAIPLAVTEQAQKAALVSLDYEDELLERVAELAATRDRVWPELVAMGLEVPRPHGNFVWIPGRDDTAEAAAIFLDFGIVARALGDGLRVSIGEPASVEKLLNGAREVVRNLRTEPLDATLD